MLRLARFIAFALHAGALPEVHIATNLQKVSVLINSCHLLLSPLVLSLSLPPIDPHTRTTGSVAYNLVVAALISLKFPTSQTRAVRLLEAPSKRPLLGDPAGLFYLFLFLFLFVFMVLWPI